MQNPNWSQDQLPLLAQFVLKKRVIIFGNLYFIFIFVCSNIRGGKRHMQLQIAYEECTFIQENSVGLQKGLYDSVFEYSDLNQIRKNNYCAFFLIWF